MFQNRYIRWVAFLLPVWLLLSYIKILGQSGLLWGLSGDPEQFIWQASNWGKVIFSGSTILRNTYFGIPTPLSYTPTVLLQSIIFNTINVLDNPVLSYNFAVGLIFLANYISWFYFFVFKKVDFWFAMLGGVVIALAPMTILQSMAHMGIFITFPFALLFISLERLSGNAGKRNWLEAGTMTALCFWSHEYWGVAAIIIFGLFLFTGGGQLVKRKMSGWALVGFVIVASPVWLVYVQQYWFQYHNGFIERRSITEASMYSASIMSYIQPDYQIDNIEKYTYLGIVNIAFLIFYAVRLILIRKIKLSKYDLIGILFFVLSLGTRIDIGGWHIYTPLAVLYKLNFPLISQIRSWGRFGILVYIPLTMAMLQEVNKTGRLKRYLLAVVLVLVFGWDIYRSSLFFSTQLSIPSVVDMIKNDTEEFFVAHIPLVVNLGALHNTKALLWQTVHQHPVVNGYTSFGNPKYEAAVAEMAIAGVEFKNLKQDDEVWTDEKCRDFIVKLKDERIKYLIWEKNSNIYYENKYSRSDEELINTKVKQVFNCFDKNQLMLSNNDEAVVKVY